MGVLGCGGENVEKSSVLNDDGAPGPQAGVRGGLGQSWGRPLGGPAHTDLLAGLPTGSPQLGAGQKSSDSPAGGGGAERGP